MNSFIDRLKLPWSTKKDVFSKRSRDEIIKRLNPLNAMEVYWGSKDRVHYSPEKVVIELNKSIASDSTPTTPPSTSVGTYLLKSVQGDYVTAGTWDGTNVGPDVYIAKPYKLRISISTAFIFGVTHAYSYGPGPDDANIKRTNTANGNSEVEYVTPPWIPNSIIGQNVGADVIYAVTATTLVIGPNGQDCGLLMVGDSRQWAAL